MIAIFFSTIFKIAKDILYFPIWWYTLGIVDVIFFIKKQLITQINSTGIVVWIKNIFVPMYGQNDFVSRIISFIIRVILIFYKSVILLLWFIVMCLVLVLWIITPVLISFLFIKSIFNLFDVNLETIKHFILVK